VGGDAWPSAARAPARGRIKGGQTVAAKCRHRRNLARTCGWVHAQGLYPARTGDFIFAKMPYIEAQE
jgi:hypothetical protein